MPTVFANDMVAHVWAQQAQEEGRSHNGNFWFQGDVIYSYRTPIARFVTGAEGQRVCLLTSESYSVTTEGKHKNAIRRAVVHNLCFSVPFFGQDWSGRVADLTEDDHAANVAHFVAAISAELDRLGRARTFTGDSHLKGLVVEVTGYTKTFGLPAPIGLRELVNDRLREIEARREARANTPAAIKRREEATKRAAEAARLALADSRERVAAWHAGAAITLRGYENRDANGGAYIRVRGDELETSLGAKVPLADAIKVFRVAKACMEQHRGWLPQHDTGSNTSLFAGHFRVDAIYTDGSFKAGCHRFSWPEIERLARALGLMSEPADAA